MLAVATLAALAMISARRGSTVLSVRRYEVETELTEHLRIVQLSDLHGHTFGTDNQELVDLIPEQS